MCFTQLAMSKFLKRGGECVYSGSKFPLYKVGEYSGEKRT